MKLALSPLVGASALGLEARKVPEFDQNQKLLMLALGAGIGLLAGITMCFVDSKRSPPTT